jgi:hypothetical protein
MGEAAGILRRILRAAPGGPAEAAPLTPARALRLAFARAADRAAGLAVAVWAWPTSSARSTTCCPGSNQA